MTFKHKMQQSKPNISKLLKHIKNASDYVKKTKYNFLAREYNLIKF